MGNRDRSDFDAPIKLETGPAGPLEFHSVKCPACGADVVVCIHGDEAAMPCSDCGVFWSGKVTPKT